MSGPERKGPAEAGPEVRWASGNSKCHLTTLGGWAIGDLCDVPGLGRCLVTALHPPSILELRTAAGGVCRVGVLVARKVRTS
jgi:hypothetical protein